MNRFPQLDDYVYLDEPSHTYWDRDGRQYQSFSRFADMFYEPFNVKIISAAVGRKEGRSGEEVAAEWGAYGSKRAGEGHQLDSAFDRYEQTGLILPEDEHLRPVIVSVVSEYNEYYKCFQQQILYDTDNFVAGMTDKMCLFSSHKDSPVDIGDYKSYTKGAPQIDLDKEGKRKHKYMLHCLSHLIDSKYNRVAIQLSFYAYLLQKKTGRRIGKLFIHLVPPNNPLGHVKIPVNYLKYEIENMLLHKQIMDREKPVEKKVSVQQEVEILEEFM